MFNAFANGFSGPTPFNGWNPFAFNGFNPSPGYNWNGFAPTQNWSGQNWQNQGWAFPAGNGYSWNAEQAGFNGFDWNAFYAGCACGVQSSCNWFINQGQSFGANSNANTNANGATGNVPGSFGPFAVFPYGPFPFSFFSQNGAQNNGQNQQAA